MGAGWRVLPRGAVRGEEGKKQQQGKKIIIKKMNGRGKHPPTLSV